MIDTLLPQVQKLVSDKTIAAFKKNGPKTVAKGLYNTLPVYLRAFIKEKTFVDFCISQQEAIFGKTILAKESVKKVAAKKIAVKKAAVKKAVKKSTVKKAK
jgi:hypothetical protein